MTETAFAYFQISDTPDIFQEVLKTFIKVTMAATEDWHPLDGAGLISATYAQRRDKPHLC